MRMLVTSSLTANLVWWLKNTCVVRVIVMGLDLMVDNRHEH